jgi:hypothetical protein
VQYVVDKYREYWGPADLAVHKNWPHWKHELRAAKIGLAISGKIVCARKQIHRKGKRWWAAYMTLPPVAEENQG